MHTFSWLWSWLVTRVMRHVLTEAMCRGAGHDWQHRYNLLTVNGDKEGIYHCARCHRAKAGEPQE